MCNPLAMLAVSAAASIGGSMISANAQKNAVNAQNEMQAEAMRRNAAMRAEEMRRQDEMRRRQYGTLDRADDMNTGEAREAAVADAEKRVVENIETFDRDQRVNDTGPSLVARSTQGNEVAEADYQKRLALAAAEARKKIQAMAKIGAYELAAAERGMATEGVNSDLDFVNQLRKGSLAVSDLGLALNNQAANSIRIQPNADGMAIGQAVAGIGNVIGNGVAKGTIDGSSVKKLFS